MHAQHVRVIRPLIFGGIGGVAFATAPGAVGKRLELLGREILQYLIVECGDECAGAICVLQHALESLACLFAFECRRAPEVGEPEAECEQVVDN